MNSVIYACGVHSLFLGIFHLAFWKIFNWKEDLKRSSFTTRAIIQIANLRLVYLFIGVAALCFVFLRVNRFFVHALTAVFVLGAILFALPLIDS